MSFEAIDWNNMEDALDATVWHKMTQNFWLPEKFAISDDLLSWATLTEKEKDATKKVFGGLTLLDTLQAKEGAIVLMDDAVTKHEVANLTFIAAIESIHARSYSSIFSTVCSTQEIREIFRWVKENPMLQKKATIISNIYNGSDPLKKKIASVYLESFLFYSGFYLPIYWKTRKKMTNTGDVISLIIRDESVHGFYIGYKFKEAFDKESAERKEEITDFAFELLDELYKLECEYAHSMYDDLGMTDDVKAFLRYNANKALQNLGFDPLFPEHTSTPRAEIIAGLGGGVNHDFFSQGGSTYRMGVVEATTDDDWD